MSYPLRKGRPITGWDGKSLDQLAYNRSLWVTARPVAQEESFLQTWLYFGLICEFTCANTTNSEEDPSSLEAASSKETIDLLYDALLVKDDGGTYVRLDTHSLDILLEIGRARMPQDPEARKERYQHLVLCLVCAQGVLFGAPKDFDHAVRCSIAALGDLFKNTADYALRRLNTPAPLGQTWSAEFFTEEVCLLSIFVFQLPLEHVSRSGS